jgi:PAS domain S-box-containing protein
MMDDVQQSLDGTTQRKRRVAGLSGYLAALCAALVIPILGFSAVIGVQFMTAERARLEGQAKELARTVRLTIDQDIAGLTALVESLATNHALIDAEYDSFDGRAREIASRVGVNVVVRDLDGQQVVNTRVPRGTPLPRVNQPETDEEAVRTQRTIVTGVFTGALAGTELVMILVPVIRNDTVVALINLSIPTERILSSIQAERPVPAWSIFVTDRSHRIVAHTDDHAFLAGQPADPQVAEGTAAMQGSYEGRGRAGEEVFVAYQRSPRSGWMIGVQVPRSILEEPLRQTVMILLLLGIGLAVISITATAGIATILRRAVRRVAEAAESMGKGQVVDAPSTAVAEADGVGAAISDASHALWARARRLHDAELRLRRVLDNLICFVAVLDRDGTVREINDAPIRATGLSRNSVIGLPFRDCHWWTHSADAQTRLQDAIAGSAEGETVCHEVEIRVAGGAIRVIDFQIAPLYDENGAVVALVFSAVDITARKRGEAQNARLAAIVSSTSDAIISFDLERHAILTWNKGAEDLFGYGEPEAIGMPVTMLIPPTPALPIENERGLFDTIIAEGQVRVDTVRRRKNGSLVDVSATGATIIDPQGRIIGVSAIFRDITARRRAEDQQKLLIRELHHRIKNTLATVQAIAGATMRSAGTMSEFRDVFAARLSALAETHSLLTDNAWDGVSLRELLDAQLASFAEEGRRITLQGPDLRLSPEALVALGMAVHELATNAIKYGALSSPAGRIAINWETGIEGAGETFWLSWKETGGPPVAKPTRAGFGSLLLERVVGPKLNGIVTVDYPPSGVEVMIKAELPSNGGSDPATAAV